MSDEMIKNHSEQAERYDREALEHDKAGNAIAAKHCRRNAVACRDTVAKIKSGEYDGATPEPMPCPDHELVMPALTVSERDAVPDDETVVKSLEKDFLTPPEDAPLHESNPERYVKARATTGIMTTGDDDKDLVGA